MFVPKEIAIKTPLGHSISATKFSKSSSFKGVVVISSATGVLQKYYTPYALYLAEEGYCVYTFDYFGIGKSSATINQLKKNTSTAEDWGSNDQAAVVEFAKNEINAPLYLITHSIGGQIMGFNSNYHLIDKVIMVASQSGYWKYYEGIHYPKMWLFWYAIIPLLTPLFGYFPAKKLGLFENLPKGMVYQWMQWGKHREYIFGHINKSDAYFDKFECPILALGFPRDIYAPKAAVDWLVNKYENAVIDRKHLIPEELGIDDVKHFGFFRPKFKESLWKLTKDWIEE